MSKSNAGQTTETWRPACRIELLRMRAEMLAIIRQFFLERSVLEVETPLLSRGITTDPNLNPFRIRFNDSPSSDYYLQPSPEFAMKRLLCSGSGSIYQICKAFREGEAGRLHNPEFTMIEWYRLGFSLEQLMAEVEGLVRRCFQGGSSFAAEIVSYQSVFFQYTGIDPLDVGVEQLISWTAQNDLAADFFAEEKSQDFWLDLIFSHRIQPQLGRQKLCFVTHFPASQAALAKISQTDVRVAERFELYWQGMELANGFDELDNADEQRQRFETEKKILDQQGRSRLVDENLITALNSGLPACCGVALGFDRLLLAVSGARSLDQVLAFPIDRA